MHLTAAPRGRASGHQTQHTSDSNSRHPLARPRRRQRPKQEKLVGLEGEEERGRSARKEGTQPTSTKGWGEGWGQRWGSRWREKWSEARREGGQCGRE